ncbi:hypothetical protein ACHAXH_003392 [Discostella pseudostelligera]
MQRLIHAAAAAPNSNFVVTTSSSRVALRRRAIIYRQLSDYPAAAGDTTSSTSTSTFSTTNTGRQRPIYVAATRQHVGKTSVSLALVSHFTKRFGVPNVGYMKAVGQQCLRVWEEPPPASSSSPKEEGHYVVIDRDVKLIRDHFQLHHLKYADMSPILIPQGYTKSYLDGQIDHDQQVADIRRAYLNIVKATTAHKSELDFGGSSINKGMSITICEGTGHAGVGSIVGTGNARVAEELGADVVLVANGGLGRAFDELQLNRAMFIQFGVNIAGVVINKVQPEKYDQTRKYLTKAIEQFWTGPNGEPPPPILGVVPDRPYLGCPALADIESTFGSTLLSGTNHRYRHYDVGSNLQGRSIGMNMVTTDLAAFLRTMQRQPDSGRTIFICHVTRDDVILGFLSEYRRRVRRGIPFQSALIICTGCDDGHMNNKIELCSEVCEMIMDSGPAGPPVLVAAGYSPAEAAKQIRTMTPKFNANDERRVSRATEHYEPYIDFDLLLERTSSMMTERGGSAV